MRKQYASSRKQRLRKQPRVRRVQSTSTITSPKIEVPVTARRRRRRNNRWVSLPAWAFRRVVLSARWISLMILGLSIYSLVLVGMDEHFYLTVIPVEGTQSISATEVVETSGLAGIHVFAADPNQAAELIAGLPGVISARVTLNWPNDVAISIQEDTPAAIWQEGFQQYWITEDGQLIAGRSEMNDLLQIESEMTPPLPDENGEAPATSLAFIPQDVLQGALNLRELRPNIHHLYYRPSGGLSFQDGRGWRVYFGTGTDMEQKLVVYETILEELLAQDLTPTYISVSNKEKPYYLAR